MTAIDLVVLFCVAAGQFVVIPLVGASLLFVCSRKVGAPSGLTFSQSWKVYLAALCCCCRPVPSAYSNSTSSSLRPSTRPLTWRISHPTLAFPFWSDLMVRFWATRRTRKTLTKPHSWSYFVVVRKRIG